jgi:hypothetical protein
LLLLDAPPPFDGAGAGACGAGVLFTGGEDGA